MFDVLILYNAPVLGTDHPDGVAEAGVLEAVDAIASALAAHGHAVRRLGVGTSAAEFFEHLQMGTPPDVVINLCEGLGGLGGGESQVAGLVELAGLPMSGSSSETLALARDKPRTKWLLAGTGIPTPKFRLIGAHESPRPEDFESLLALGPVIVKPAREDGSLGIGPDSVVADWSRLRRQVELVHDRYGDALVEQFIEGREFNAGVISLPDEQLLPLSEIEFDPGLAPGERLVTYDAKWAGDSIACQATPPRCPALVEPALAERIGRVALAAYRAVGCRDYARVDLRTDARGEAHVLEVNPNPDISPAAGLARALAAAGLAYDQFVARLVDEVWRTRSERRL